MSQSTTSQTPVGPIYFDIVSFLRILITNSWIIGLVTVIGAVATYLYVESQPEVYESYSSMIVLPFQNTEDEEIGDGNQLEALRLLNLNVIGTYVQILRSRVVEDNAEAVLLETYSEDDIDDTEITIRPIENSSIVTITARSSSPELAQQTVQEYASQLIDNTPSAVEEVITLYPIEILDAADLNEEAVAPQTRLVLVLGILGSAAVGVAVAFLFHNLTVYTNFRKSQNG